MIRMTRWTIAAVVAVLASPAAFAAQPTTGPGAVTGGNFTPPPPDHVPVCTRASLQAAVKSYLDAQASGDAKRIAFADKVKYLENMKDVDAGAGLWNRKLDIAFSRSIYDATRCKTFTEVVVTQGEKPYVIGTRLYVDDGKVTRIDSIVTTKGDWLFNANNTLKFAKAEDWSITPTQRTKPEDMINGANAYLDLFADKHREAPWGQPCARLEGGMYTNAKSGNLNDPGSTCKVGIPAGVLYIVNRDYVVDEEQGVVNVFCRFGDSKTGMPDSHTFHYVSGKFRWVHTLSQSLPRESPQVADY
jgi:hypothetical protein